MVIDNRKKANCLAAKVCEKEWKAGVGVELPEIKVEDGKALQTGLTGKVMSIVENRHFTFICSNEIGKQIYARLQMFQKKQDAAAQK